MNKNNMLFLIDGSSLLSSAFFGTLPNSYRFSKTDEERDAALPELIQTSTGVYTNGISTMFRQIENIIKKVNPTHLAVAWDLTRDTFRRGIYPLYKSNRKDGRPELLSQFAIAQEMLKDMNIPTFAYMEYEADDVIGTLSRRFEDVIKVVILTKDQDALQLITSDISVWLVTSKAKDMYLERGINLKDSNLISGVFEFNPITFREVYGIDPIQMIDKKALEGDPSDNIPGVKGVGEKAVIPLLQEFGTVEGIYEYLEETPLEEAKAFLKELGIKRSPISYLMKIKTSEEEICGKECALLCKELATIKIDLPELQNISLEDLSLNISQEGRLRAYEKYELNSLASTYKEK